jgi:hypothetical protein
MIFANKDYEELNDFQIYNGCYFVPSSRAINKTINENNITIDISGSGIYKDQFISKPHDFFNVLKNNYPPTIDSMGKEIRGSLSFYLINTTEQHVEIIADPLGGAIIFYYKSDSISVFSNSITSIINVLNMINIYPKKSMDYLTELISTGNGGYFESSYEGIHALKPFQYIKGINNSFSIQDYTWKHEFFSPISDYNAGLELAVEEIKNNIKAVTNYKNSSYKIAHLTGGFDSRLVLSSILNTDSSDHYHFFCSGNSDMPDRHIAEKLSSEFNLTMTEYGGQSPLNTPSTLEEEYLWQMQFTGGILSTAPKGQYERNNNIILSGGYGECFRSFFGARKSDLASTDLETIMSTLWGNLFFSKNEEDALFSASFKKRLSEQMKKVMNEPLEYGLREDAHLDYLYTRVRNRYYVGVTSHNWSEFGARFDPLYSLNAIKLAMSVPQDMRTANIIGIDIMNRLFEDLTALPFEREVFNGSYIKYRGMPNLRSFSSTERPKFDLEELIAPAQKARTYPATLEQKAKAKKMKAALWQVVELKRVQQKLIEFISSIPSQEVSSIFNRKILNRLLKSDLNSRVHIRTVFTIYSVLLWYFNNNNDHISKEKAHLKS